MTLVELLVAMLILGVLMAVAAPLYLSAVATSERRTCRANMQTIGNAVHSFKMRMKLSYPSAGTPVDLAMAPDLTTVPVCPSEGSYTIQTGTGGAPFNVKCSVTAHGEHQYSRDTG